MTDDPLASMLSRALGEPIGEARSERLGVRDGVEIERVRFGGTGGDRTLLIERFAPRNALEAQLLPFLARKTDRVPVVHARGIPHSVRPAPSWVLVEDLDASRSACDGDPRAIVDAKVAVERAVAADGPALAALGVPRRMPADIAEAIAAAAPAAADEAREAARRLAKWPAALVHGDLSCASAVTSARGTVLRRWGRAHIGCALLDIARLVAELVSRDDAVRGIGLSRYYAETLEILLPTEVLRAAERLDVLAQRHLSG